jgi:hypothetical protein
MYYLEKILLTCAGIACFIAIWFIPRKKADRAVFVFLSSQFFTWILGLITVEFAWLDYPVHELSKANSTSFLFEYFMLPIIIIFFVLHYPFNKPLKFRILYYVSFSSSFTLIEYFLEKYTMVIKYHSWKWYWTWISLLLVFYVVMVIYKWFYKIKKVFSL